MMREVSNCSILLVTDAFILSVNIGRWVLRNLFLSFVREEQRIRRPRDRNANDGGLQASLHRSDGRNRSDLALATPHRRSSSSGRSSVTLRSLAGSVVVSSPELTPAVVPIFAHPVKKPSLQTPMISLHPITTDDHSFFPTPQALSSESRPTLQHGRSNLSEAEYPPMSSSSKESDFTIRPREPGQAPSEDNPKRANSQDSGTTPTPLSPGGAVRLMGRLKSLGKGSVKKTGEHGPVPIGPPGTPHTSETLSVAEVRFFFLYLILSRLIFRPRRLLALR
jgi:WD repeat-containing protein 48